MSYLTGHCEISIILLMTIIIIFISTILMLSVGILIVITHILEMIMCCGLNDRKL